MTNDADTQTPDQAALATGSAAAGTGGQTDWQAKAEEWQRRFTGLQATYQKAQTQLADAQGKVQDLTTAQTRITGEREAAVLEVDLHKKQAASYGGERDTLKGQLERLTVLSDFPALMPLERKQLLPAGNGEELRGRLTELMKTLTTQGLANTLPEGATPPGPNPAKKDRSSLMAEVRKFQNEGNKAGYESAYDALMALDKPA